MKIWQESVKRVEKKKKETRKEKKENKDIAWNVENAWKRDKKVKALQTLHYKKSRKKESIGSI